MRAPCPCALTVACSCTRQLDVIFKAFPLQTDLAENMVILPTKCQALLIQLPGVVHRVRLRDLMTSVQLTFVFPLDPRVMHRSSCTCSCLHCRTERSTYRPGWSCWCRNSRPCNNLMLSFIRTLAKHLRNRPRLTLCARRRIMCLTSSPKRDSSLIIERDGRKRNSVWTLHGKGAQQPCHACIYSFQNQKNYQCQPLFS